MQETKYTLRKRWTLVVDDSSVVREKLSLFLKKRGYICHTADDAYQALAAVEKNQYDIIFMDVVMPGMDGYMACRKIKAMPSYKQTPVVLLTSQDSAADRKRGMMSGCARYLTKPFKFEELDELVLKLCVPRRPSDTYDHLPPVTGRF